MVDLAWAADGLTLLAASTDGSVTLLQFATSDLALLASKQVCCVEAVPVYTIKLAREQMHRRQAGSRWLTSRLLPAALHRISSQI